MTARSIEVTTAIEELGCHLVAGEIIDRAQRYPHETRLVGILTQRDREFQPLDLLGDVDEALGIALDKVEPFQFLLGESVVGSMVLR